MTRHEIINQYLKILMVKRLSKNTIDAYKNCVNVFLNWCEEKDIYPPSISKDDLLDFFLTIESNAYLKQMRGTIGNIYEYVFNIKYILNGMPFPKQTKGLPDYFSIEELIQIFNHVKNPKQRMILKLQYACALRVHEVVKIKWNDFIKSQHGFDLKVTGKGGVTEYLPVPDETITELIHSMGDRMGSNCYLFQGQFKDFYSTRSVQSIINRAMEELKIFKDGSTHLLRHSRATHLIQSGASMRHVQILLRHKNSKTTEVYTHLNTSDLRIVCDSADKIINEKSFLIGQNKTAMLLEKTD